MMWVHVAPMIRPEPADHEGAGIHDPLVRVCRRKASVAGEHKAKRSG